MRGDIQDQGGLNVIGETWMLSQNMSYFQTPCREQQGRLASWGLLLYDLSDSRILGLCLSMSWSVFDFFVCFLISASVFLGMLPRSNSLLCSLSQLVRVSLLFSTRCSSRVFHSIWFAWL